VAVHCLQGRRHPAELDAAQLRSKLFKQKTELLKIKNTMKFWNMVGATFYFSSRLVEIEFLNLRLKDLL